MAARTKTKVSPKYKTKYRVKNWPAYDLALRDRGDITVWFDEESICALECASDWPSWWTTKVLRLGNRYRTDLENGLPLAVASDRRLRRFSDWPHGSCPPDTRPYDALTTST